MVALKVSMEEIKSELIISPMRFRRGGYNNIYRPYKHVIKWWVEHRNFSEDVLTMVSDVSTDGKWPLEVVKCCET